MLRRAGPRGPAPDKNGDMFQAPPRRDYVSPVEPVDGEHGTPDNPNGQPRMELNKSASLAQNRGVQIHPRPPSAATPASGGQKRREKSTPGHKRGHVPSAVRGATTCPRSIRRAATGAAPKLQGGSGMRSPDTTTTCLHSCSPEGATENSPGVQFSPEIGGAQSKSRQGRKKIAPGFNPGSTQPQRP